MNAEVPARRSYERGELTETDAPSAWFPLFERWFADAVDAAERSRGGPGSFEANAIQVATADAEGRPSLRTVLAKAVDARGVVFFTNHDSAKGRELAANPNAAVLFSWQPLERQVRLVGTVEQVPRHETEEYFATRPHASQIGAWASPQSSVIASRDELDAAVARTEARFADGGITAPPFWGGYRLRPVTVEFWQGRASRLHDRLRYRRDADAWVLERLAP